MATGIGVHNSGAGRRVSGQEVVMVCVHIEIDEEVLELAMTLGGHPTATEAIAEALRQYNQRLAHDEQRLNRAAALRHYFELARDWDTSGAEAAHAAEKHAHKR
jgi:hypothetical protein